MLGDQLEQSKRLDPRQEMLKKDPLNKALLKLEEEFERLLTESSRVIDLSKHLTSSPGATADDQASEKNTAPSPTPRVELMDPDTSNKLLVISDRLKVNGRIDYCLEVYKEIRVKIVMKSIVTLKPEYLRSYSMEELNRMQWKDFRDNLSLCTHLGADVMNMSLMYKLHHHFLKFRYEHYVIYLIWFTIMVHAFILDLIDGSTSCVRYPIILIL